MTDLISSEVDRFLAEKAQGTTRRGRLIFALDATASRQETWDTACQLQAEMFREVAGIGLLDVQLVYYRDPEGHPEGECRASRWYDSPAHLTKAMSSIVCRAGYTQIARVLAHIRQEATRSKINALVFVGDACEESRDTLIQPAADLDRLGVPAFLLQEGHDPRVERVFREIAQVTKGAHLRFNTGAAAQLAELLRAIALFAVRSRRPHSARGPRRRGSAIAWTNAPIGAPWYAKAERTNFESSSTAARGSIYDLPLGRDRRGVHDAVTDLDAV